MLVFNRFYFCRLAETAVSGSPSVTWLSRKWCQSGESVRLAILDCSLNVYACGRQKALTMPAYCVAANCNNSQATQSITMHEFPRNRPAVRRKWVRFVQFKRDDFDAAHLCSEHFAECDFVNFIGRNTKWGLFQSGICRAIRSITDLEKNPVRISKDEADEQQAHSMIPKTERYTDTLKQALIRQRQKV